MEAQQLPVAPDNNKMTIIAWSGDLDRLYPTLILATTAAASGMDVTVFFTFWGLTALKKTDKLVGDFWMTKLLSFMRRGTHKHLPLSQMNMLGMGPWMMKKVFKRYNIATIPALLESAGELGVRLIGCQMTMEAFGIKKEDMVDTVCETCGAATALEYASQSKISLFI